MSHPSTNRQKNRQHFFTNCPFVMTNSIPLLCCCIYRLCICNPRISVNFYRVQNLKPNLVKKWKESHPSKKCVGFYLGLLWFCFLICKRKRRVINFKIRMLPTFFWNVSTVFNALPIWENDLVNEREKHKQIRTRKHLHHWKAKYVFV